MIGAQFMHPALARVAMTGPMQMLQQAAIGTGMAPPLTALQYIDCSPQQIYELANQVQHGADIIGNAHATFGQARSTADHNWSGPAADSFNTSAAALDGYYTSVQQAAENTAQAGSKIAQSLGDLTTSVANKSGNIASQVYPASALVAQGDRTPQNLEIVNWACTQIVNLVQNADNEIPGIGSALTDLTEPTLDSGEPHGTTGRSKLGQTD